MRACVLITMVLSKVYLVHVPREPGWVWVGGPTGRRLRQEPGSGVSVAGISQNFSLVPSQILNTAIAFTVVYAPERQSSPFSKLATEIIPEALLKVSVVFT